MRITLDTNQLVRALMRPPNLATFVMAWAASRFSVVYSRAMLQEYDRVLADPKLSRLLYPELMRAYDSYLKNKIEFVEAPSTLGICRDPDDDKVLSVALTGNVDYLVTADEDLRTPSIRRLLDNAGIGVVTIDELVKMLD